MWRGHGGSQKSRLAWRAKHSKGTGGGKKKALTWAERRERNKKRRKRLALKKSRRTRKTGQKANPIPHPFLMGRSEAEDRRIEASNAEFIGL